MSFAKNFLNTGLVALTIATSSVGFASDVDTLNSQVPFTEYYRIDENFQSQQTFSIESQFMSTAKKMYYSLLKLTRFTNSFVGPTEKYQRRMHFGRWINDPTDDTCQNTRAKVLVRDSAGPVTFRNGRQCIVDTGLWDDQYTGLQLNNARQIQVDHMVPLKHAWLTGAADWDFKTRCLYANFLGNQHHLIPVYAHENMSKGDSGPDRYIPPNTNITCGYLKNWLQIKLAWRLVLPAHEVEAIAKIISENNCDENSFTVTTEEIKQTRQFITDNIEYCSQNRRQ